MANSVVIGINRWEDLPRHIILMIFSHLAPTDRLAASLTCKLWGSCMQSPILWRDFTFRFETPEEHPRSLTYLGKYGGLARSIRIGINPRESQNCTNASRVLTDLARLKERSLERLNIHFTKGNPLFFRGLDILSSLAELFGPPDPHISFRSSLRVLDLSGMAIAVDDRLMNLLAGNQPHVEVMNMQNKSLTCRITPQCMENFVRKCRKLRRLITFYKCMSDRVLFAMADREREPIKYLSLLCKMEEKYHRRISNETWGEVADGLPSLRVAMHFDHTSDREQIRDILKQNIPLVELSMRSQLELHREVDLVGKYFNNTLERFTVSTAPNAQVESALVYLASASIRLRELHVYSSLGKGTIREILSLRPELSSYTLKTDIEDRELPPIFYGRFANVQAAIECMQEQEQVMQRWCVEHRAANLAQLDS